MDQVELLAPAKDLNTGIAAINCGADAVYIGAASFGARKEAGNSLKDIETLVSYAHKYWARVYVTVNTLLHDKELDAADKLIRDLYEIGVDAIIIQDTGILELNLPPIPLFASTQMHNHSIDRVSFLEKVGFQRVILARELSLEQIKEIKSATTIELETFIHGALCVSYSGQCYMSYAIGGRSGNRGQCAQPCRRRYTLINETGKEIAKERHLLSLKDLNLSHDLGSLIDAGVCSFKIEGRLKNEAYVMNIVGFYRQQLDAIINEHGKRPSSSGKVSLGFTPDPLKTFNRGYTSYFLHGRGDQIANFDTPKSIGEPIGKVISLQNSAITLNTTSPKLHPGDGLCFLDKQMNLCGTSVNTVESNKIYLNDVKDVFIGAEMFRNFDHNFLSLLEKSKPERQIEVQFMLTNTPTGLKLNVVDEDNCEATAEITLDPVIARSPDKSLETIDRQLRKLGTTAFICKSVECKLDPVLFLPVSAINKLRRQVIQNLIEERLQKMPRNFKQIERNTAPFPSKHLDFSGNVLNHKAASFYKQHGVISIENAAESSQNMDGKKIMTTKHCLRFDFGACPRHNSAEAGSQPWKLVDENGIEFPVRFNCSKCEMEVFFKFIPEDL